MDARPLQLGRGRQRSASMSKVWSALRPVSEGRPESCGRVRMVAGAYGAEMRENGPGFDRDNPKMTAAVVPGDRRVLPATWGGPHLRRPSYPISYAGWKMGVMSVYTRNWVMWSPWNSKTSQQGTGVARPSGVVKVTVISEK